MKNDGALREALHPKNVIMLSVIAATLSLAGCLYLDHPIALLVRKLFRKNPAFSSYVVDLPDLLLPAVIVITTILWAAWLYHARRGIDNDMARFERLASWTVPLAYLLKVVSKILFGRINTRYWLMHQAGREFHWFHGGENYSGFPSGHMAVFTALAVSFWLHYPRFRPAGFALLAVLGTALIVTNYHFLSDVVAGAYLGLMVNVCVARMAPGGKGGSGISSPGAP